MSRSTIVVVALAAIVTSAAAFALAFVMARGRTASPPLERPRRAVGTSAAPQVLWQVPPFSFSDQNGRPTTAADLRGHVWIADFIFTSCTSICPLITAKMAMLQRRLEARKTLRFVSFSVDPARDTPEALKRYAAAWRPAETRWILLSTTPEGLQKLASAMYVDVRPIENDIAHSSLFFLVDEKGGVRSIYESDKNDALERLVRDTEALATASAVASNPAPATGSDLYGGLGCAACHARKDLAPPIEGLLGRRVELAGGGTVVADTAYVRESIANPEAKLVQGYSLKMPGYGHDLSPDDFETLVAYTVMLASAPAAKPEATATTAKAEAPVATVNSTTPAQPAEKTLVVVDPVCSMDVRVVDTTPRASHDGRTFYFCSELCRNRFVKDPARYDKPTAR